MTKTLKLFVASAALTAAIGLPAWSGIAVHSAGEVLKPVPAVLDDGDAAQFILVDDDEDEDDDGSPRKRRHSADEDHDDDHDDDDDDDDDCDDDEDNCQAAKAPAPAGSAAPPQNGLFSNGAAPKVQVK